LPWLRWLIDIFLYRKLGQFQANESGI